MAALAVLAALLAGCGEGGEETASANVTKAQFVKAANDICAARHEERHRGAPEPEGKTPTEAEQRVERLMEEVVLPSLKKEQEEFENLGVPKEGEAQVKEILESYSQLIEEIEQGGVEALYNADAISSFVEGASAYGIQCRI